MILFFSVKMILFLDIADFCPYITRESLEYNAENTIPDMIPSLCPIELWNTTEHSLASQVNSHTI